jgi:uncharacterized membrane protein
MTPVWVPRPKYFLFTVIAAMFLVVFYKDFHLIHPSAVETEHYRSFKWWLVPHGITGALALFLGPLQFSKKLRQRHLNFHRLAGRTYVVGVAIAAPLGVYIEYVKYANGVGSLRLVIATLGFATLFMVTTGVGFIKIKQRAVQQHRRWMTRSFAVALIFLETRCIDQISWLNALFQGASNLFESHHIADLWILIICAPIAAEIALCCEDMLGRKPSRRAQGAASA